MEILYFSNNKKLIVNENIFNCSDYQYDNKLIYLTGIAKMQHEDINSCGLEKILKNEEYYFNYDVETNEFFFIFREYHDFIKNNKIDLLMYDMNSIEDIYMHVFEDFIINKYKMKIIKKYNNDYESVYILKKEENYSIVIKNYIDLLQTKNFFYIFSFLSLIKQNYIFSEVDNSYKKI